MTSMIELTSETMANLIDTYCEVWGIADAASRRRQLSSVWTAGATYTDPTLETAGAEEFLTHIGFLIAENPGSRVERTSSVDSHNGFARFTWRLVLADATTLIEGTDFMDLTPEGRIERIIGFFGPLT